MGVVTSLIAIARTVVGRSAWVKGLRIHKRVEMRVQARKA